MDILQRIGSHLTRQLGLPLPNRNGYFMNDSEIKLICDNRTQVEPVPAWQRKQDDAELKATIKSKFPNIKTCGVVIEEYLKNSIYFDKREHEYLRLHFKAFDYRDGVVTITLTRDSIPYKHYFGNITQDLIILILLKIYRKDPFCDAFSFDITPDIWNIMINLKFPIFFEALKNVMIKLREYYPNAIANNYIDIPPKGIYNFLYRVMDEYHLSKKYETDDETPKDKAVPDIFDMMTYDLTGDNSEPYNNTMALVYIYKKYNHLFQIILQNKVLIGYADMISLEIRKLLLSCVAPPR